MMMQKFQKKKGHFPFVVLLLAFFILIVVSILYSESYIQEIHQNQQLEKHGNDHHPASVLPIFLHNETLVQKSTGQFPFLQFQLSRSLTLLSLFYMYLKLLGVFRV